jgi:hypothetical protein
VNYGGAKNVREILTTDDVRYGGSGKCNRQIKIADHGFCIALAPLATMIFEIDR